MTDFELGQIVALHDVGWSMRQIAKKMGRTHPCIMKFLKKYKARGTCTRVVGSGRPRLTTPRDDRRFVAIARAKRNISARHIAFEADIDVSKQTVIRRLGEAGMKSCVACKKPLISEKNRKQRFAWCKAHLTWTKEQWRQVLWTDESPYTLRWKGKKLVWRQKWEKYCPECMQATLKHDKKIMLSGSFAATGVGSLVRVRGHMTGAMYREIAKTYLVPAGVRLLGRGFTFQQDNDPKHTSNVVKRYFGGKTDDGTLLLLDWPSQSPDLNPIEHLWFILDLRTKDRRSMNEDQLMAALLEGWEKIPLSMLENLIDSMPKRCGAVIANDGWPTAY